MSSIQLSPNFFLHEFLTSTDATRRGIANVPDPLSTRNLYALAQLLEDVRKLCASKPVTVSSGFRGLELNRIVGGSVSSEHMTGEAADFIIPGFGNPLAICRAIVKSDLQFGQLIHEGDWVHISLPGRFRRQVLTARFVRNPETGKTKAVYVPGLQA